MRLILSLFHVFQGNLIPFVGNKKIINVNKSLKNSILNAYCKHSAGFIFLFKKSFISNLFCLKTATKRRLISIALETQRLLIEVIEHNRKIILSSSQNERKILYRFSHFPYINGYFKGGHGIP